jgi:hypothetical protein
LLEGEDALHGSQISGVAAQTEDGFGGVGNHAAGLDGVAGG